MLTRWLWTAPIVRSPESALCHLHCETVVDAPLADVFSFFSDIANLERITPPWLSFRTRTPAPVEMREGAEIDHQIVLHGLPIPWRTRIDVWEPDARFVDRQVLGPYRWWRHEHRFQAVGNQTLVIDDIEYIPRVRWLSKWLTRRDVERIFSFRQQTLPTLFAAR